MNENGHFGVTDANNKFSHSNSLTCSPSVGFALSLGVMAACALAIALNTSVYLRSLDAEAASVGRFKQLASANIQGRVLPETTSSMCGSNCPAGSCKMIAGWGPFCVTQSYCRLGPTECPGSRGSGVRDMCVTDDGQWSCTTPNLRPPGATCVTCSFSGGGMTPVPPPIGPLPPVTPPRPGSYLGCFGGYQISPQTSLAARYSQDVRFAGADYTMTNAKCISICAQHGYRYAATAHYTTCDCNNEPIPSTRLVGENQCYSKCPGNQSEWCGGPAFYSLYSTGVGNSSPPNPAPPAGPAGPPPSPRLILHVGFVDSFSLSKIEGWGYAANTQTQFLITYENVNNTSQTIVQTVSPSITRTDAADWLRANHGSSFVIYQPLGFQAVPSQVLTVPGTYRIKSVLMIVSGSALEVSVGARGTVTVPGGSVPPPPPSQNPPPPVTPNPSPPPAPPASMVHAGFIDSFTSTQVEGWAYDANNSTQIRITYENVANFSQTFTQVAERTIVRTDAAEWLKSQYGQNLPVNQPLGFIANPLQAITAPGTYRIKSAIMDSGASVEPSLGARGNIVIANPAPPLPPPPPGGNIPSVNITFPVNGGTVAAGNINVRYIVEGAAENLHAHLQLDNLPEIMDLDLDGWVTLSAVAPGNHNLKIYLARADHSAVSGTEKNINFTASGSPPPPPVLPPPSVHNYEPFGYLDLVNQDGVASGWAMDPNDLSGQVSIHFYVDAPAGPGRSPAFHTLANVLRNDVGPRGFEAGVPAAFRDNQTHSLYAYGVDLEDGSRWRELVNSPKTFKLSGGNNPTPPPPPTALPPPPPPPVSPNPPPPPAPNPPPPASGSGAADLSLLPVANKQRSTGNPQVSTAGGSFYVDATSGVKVWRATSADYPCGGNGTSYHDYGDITQISRDLGGNKHTLLIRTCGKYRLVDFTRGQGFSNWRDVVSGAVPTRDLNFTFSNKPETPHIAYSLRGSTLVRLNTLTNQVENSGNFPIQFGDGSWLQNDESDRMFVMTTGTTCRAWNSQTNQMLTHTWSRLDECHLENRGRYVNLNTGVGGDMVWDLVTNSVKPLTPPGGNIFHHASPSGYFTSVDVNLGGGKTPHFRLDPVTGTGVKIHDFCGYMSGFHQSGSWIQPGTPDERQWFMISTHEGGGNGCLINALGFMRLDGSDVRFLAHNFHQGGGYFQTPFGTVSPDGKVAMFNSTGGRSAGDVYVVEVPLSNLNSPPPPPPAPPPPPTSIIRNGFVDSFTSNKIEGWGYDANVQTQFRITYENVNNTSQTFTQTASQSITRTDAAEWMRSFYNSPGMFVSQPLGFSANPSQAITAPGTYRIKSVVMTTSGTVIELSLAAKANITITSTTPPPPPPVSTIPPPPPDSGSSGALRSYSTIHSIGLEWDILNDPNHNAKATVAYRAAGGGWKQGLQLMRIDSNGKNMLAGSIMFLNPATTYEVSLTLIDPDGGNATKSTMVSTRTLPQLPSGRTLHVVSGGGGGDGSVSNPFRGVAAAQAAAQPGDVLLLHAGSYGAVSFSKPGGMNNHIVWKAAGDGEVLFDRTTISASNVWLEGITIRNQQYALMSQNTPENVVITKSQFLNNHYSIYLQGGGRYWYITDNTIYGDVEPSSESWGGEGIELNSCERESNGHTVAHNSITHVADGISYPGSNVDIFGNDIFDTSDDGIEADCGKENVRMWQNRIHNAGHNSITFQPQSGAPWYIVRNQIMSAREAPFKFRQATQFVILHNTIVMRANMICCFENQLMGAFARNNLWISANGGRIWNLPSKDWRTDFDYDGFDSGGTSPFSYNGQTHSTVSSFAAASGLEQHGIQIQKANCFTSFNFPGGPPTPIPPQHLSLKAGCGAVDAAQILPNINDGFSGAAPDMGAHEFGSALIAYGPRSGNIPSVTPPPPPPPPPTSIIRNGFVDSFTANKIEGWGYDANIQTQFRITYENVNNTSQTFVQTVSQSITRTDAADWMRGFYNNPGMFVSQPLGFTANPSVAITAPGTYRIKSVVMTTSGTVIELSLAAKANITITSTPPPPPPVSGSIITGQTVACVSGSFGPSPECPRLVVDTNVPQQTGRTITVLAGGNLQSAINEASFGDTILLSPGATYTGGINLPNKSGSGWVVITTQGFSVPAGTRVSPQHAGQMAKIVGTSGNIITVPGGSHHFRFIGVEIAYTGTQNNYGLVYLSDSGSPHHIIFDRVYIHGNNNANTKFAFHLSGSHNAVIDSHISEMHSRGTDFESYGVEIITGPGPFKVANNHIEAAMENVMFGGGRPSGGVIPADVEVRNNFIRKPLAWMPDSSQYAGKLWDIKNLLEIKHGIRILVEGNTFEHIWASRCDVFGGPQHGWTMLVWVSGDSGGTTSDIAIANNIIRNVHAGIQLSNVVRSSITNNLFENVGDAAMNYSAACTPDRRGVVMELRNLTGSVVNHNTSVKSDNQKLVSQATGSNLVFMNNIGRSTVAVGFGTSSKNVLVGGSSSGTNFGVASFDAVGFTDYSAGNYRLSGSSPYKNQGTDGKDIGVVWE